MNVYSPGARIADRYEVAGRPMLGGMGIVYICHDLQDDRPVALKTFRPEYLPDRAARDRFLREGTHWVELGAHLHIVCCYQVIRVGDGTEVYLTLELVAKEEGRADASLRSWLFSSAPLPVEQSLLFALQIVRGMQHAIETIPGFVHRDLKPENILVGADRLHNVMDINRVRVTDFGLAVAFEADAIGDHTGEGSASVNPSRSKRGIVGTPLYMAPEQWRREPVSIATDVYALGCILYEMLTGQSAAMGNNVAELEHVHCEGKLRPLPTNVRAEVATVVTRCLSTRSHERYTSWSEIEAALIAVQGQIAEQAAPGPEDAIMLKSIDEIASGWSFHALGASYLDIGKADMALTCFQRTQDIGETQGEQRLIGAGLNGLGLAHRDLGSSALAAEETEKALNIARKLEDKRAERAVMGNLGTCYRRLGRYDEALACHERCLFIAQQLGDRAAEATSLSGLGLYYQETGQIKTAINYHEQHLEVTKEVGDRAGEMSARINLGICHFVSGEAAIAATFYKRALDLARQIGDLKGEGSALAGLGQCAFHSDAPKAQDYLERALGIAREVGDRHSEAGALGALAVCFYQAGQSSEAERLAWESLEIAEQVGSILVSAGTCFLLITLLVQQQRLPEALSLAERAEQMFNSIGLSQYAQLMHQRAVRIQDMSIRKK